jgi:hypothetical protein
MYRLHTQELITSVVDAYEKYVVVRVCDAQIDCNMCNLTWHHDCLTPVIKPGQRSKPGFFACFKECIDEFQTKYEKYERDQQDAQL